MPSGGDGDLEFGAHTVGGGDKNRVLVARRFQIEQCAEAAETRVAAGPGRRSRQRFQSLDECRPGIDIDSGGAILVQVILAPYGVLTRCRV
jgi:hypothetical protein